MSVVFVKIQSLDLISIMAAARETPPEDLGGYVDNLGSTFLATYDAKTALNPARYFSSKCNDLCDTFLDALSQIGGRSNAHRFTASQLGDEIEPEPKEDTLSLGKRAGPELEGPDHKKRRLNDEGKGSADGMGSDEDIGMDSDDEEEEIPQKKGKRKKRKLPEKYKDDEDFQSLEAPPDAPSKAVEFFDPISHCKVSLERESRMNVRTRDRIQKYQMIGRDDVDIDGGGTEYVDRTQIDRYIKSTGNSRGYTVQQDVSKMLCLGLQDHLKNVLDEMERWRRMRRDHHGQRQRQRGLAPVRHSGMDAQEWMDCVNSKYAEKQQIVEAQDELQSLMDEQTDLKMQRLTGILSVEEEKRLQQLPSKINAAKNRQKESAERRDQINVSAMKAVGGDFSFGANRKKAKELRADKFYVIDVVNLLGAHQRMNQQHLKQLSTLYLKQTS